MLVDGVIVARITVDSSRGLFPVLAHLQVDGTITRRSSRASTGSMSEKTVIAVVLPQGIGGPSAGAPLGRRGARRCERPFS